jgi:sulfur-carrier protein
MRVSVHFYSYFKDLTGCAEITEDLPSGATIDQLLANLFAKFPKLAAMQRSMLIAVGVEYQKPEFLLREGDDVSLFPPVQGG